MTNALTEEYANLDEQATRMRAMWSAVVLTSLNDAIRHTATESKKHKGLALKTLRLWANSRDGRKVISLAGINPDKRTTEGMVAFAVKGVPTTQPRTYGCREGCGVTERACKWCGGGMEGKRRDAVFCSKKCISALRHQANAEQISEKKRKYYKANAEKIREYNRETNL